MLHMLQEYDVSSCIIFLLHQLRTNKGPTCSRYSIRSNSLKSVQWAKYQVAQGRNTGQRKDKVSALVPDDLRDV